MKKTLITIAAAFGLAAASNAALLTPTSVTGYGSYTNDASLISDGTIPSENSSWTSATNVYWTASNVSFVLDLGAIYNLSDILVSVDNNDTYNITFSETFGSWSPLVTILPSYGEIGWGMDTMSSDSGNPEYVSGIDFSPVNARYVKIEATGSDYYYALGEVQLFGSATQNSSHGVPDSGSTLIMGLAGFLGLGFLRRKLKA